MHASVTSPMQSRCVKRSSFVRFPPLLGPSCFLSTVFFDRRFYHCRFITIVFCNHASSGLYQSLRIVVSFFARFFVGTSPASHRASTTRLLGSSLSINQDCSCSRNHFPGPHNMRPPYCDRSSSAGGIPRSPRESLQRSEPSR